MYELSHFYIETEHVFQIITAKGVIGDSDVEVDDLFEYKVIVDAQQEDGFSHTNFYTCQRRVMLQLIALVEEMFGKFQILGDRNWYYDLDTNVLWMKKKADVLQLKLTFRPSGTG